MKQNDELIVNIEKLSNLGTGIARVDGQVVFVENACPEDVVKVKILKVNKNYATAKVVDIVTSSPHRVEPFCPMQKVCGACQMQFIDYDYQLQLKKQMVQDAMRTIGNLDIVVNDPIASPEVKNYRHKIQYPVSQTKNSTRIIAGYFKQQSHEIVNIKYCPIQPEICDKIIDFVRENTQKFNITGFNEKKHTGDLRHVVVRSSATTGDCLVTFVVNATKTYPRLNDFAKAIFENFEQVVGVCINFNSKKTNVILGRETVCVCGQDFVEEKIIDKTFKIGADTFFQVNPKSAENIFKYVKNEIEKMESPTVLDAYAGIATFGIVVSEVAQKVVSVEENKASIDKAQEVLSLNGISNVELHVQDTLKYLKSVKRKFDAVILDPPRKGCTQDVLDEVLKHVKTSHFNNSNNEILKQVQNDAQQDNVEIREEILHSTQNDVLGTCHPEQRKGSQTSKIIYVSCNPATLARDLKYMTEHGAKVESIQPFDMFCYTYHIENVAIIEV